MEQDKYYMEQDKQKEIFFAFERDFTVAHMRCIPMIVRFKLDACGIKLKLAEWSRMTGAERAHLACAPCETAPEIQRYREDLRALIVQRTGNTPIEIPVLSSPPWSRMDEIPFTVKEKSDEIGLPFSVEQWRQLSALQRFALMKLSYPGHENKNFPTAMAEFGLLKVAKDGK